MNFGPTPRKTPSLAFKRLVRVIAAIPAGEFLTKRNVTAFRPTGGMHPAILFRPQIYMTVRDVRKEEAITERNVNYLLTDSKSDA